MKEKIVGVGGFYQDDTGPIGPSNIKKTSSILFDLPKK